MSAFAARAPLIPSSAIPIAYFGFAHAALASGCALLALYPSLPGGFFYHPRMVALAHLLTLGWLSASILGALYIVAPLALGFPMPGRRADWIACAVYVIGVVGMVAHFWIAEYSGMAWSAGMAIATIGWVGGRVWRGLASARVPGAIALHVRLAFVNVFVAAIAGLLIGIDRESGILAVSPLTATYAHAHVAAIGWVAMMVIGLGYRLIPMMLPSALPSGRGLGLSALLIEAGVAATAAALLAGSPWVLAGAGLIASGLASAAWHLRRAIADRRPRPPKLPAIDWSALQVAAAFAWMGIATIVGMLLAAGATVDAWYVESMWLYGVAGLVGWLAQMVAAMQGRLVPMYAWYRAMAHRAGASPARAVHELISPRLAALVFAAWTAGVPLLAAGVAIDRPALIRVAALLLLAGIGAGAGHIVLMLRRAAAPAADTATNATR